MTRTEITELNKKPLQHDEKSRPDSYNPSEILLFEFFFTPPPNASLDDRNHSVLACCGASAVSCRCERNKGKLFRKSFFGFVNRIGVRPSAYCSLEFILPSS